MSEIDRKERAGGRRGGAKVAQEIKKKREGKKKQEKAELATPSKER